MARALAYDLVRETYKLDTPPRRPSGAPVAAISGAGAA